MVADLAGVIAQLQCALGIILCFHGIEVGRQRRLGVDDHLFAARQTDDQVGPEAAVSCGEGDLLEKVGVLDHAGQFHDLAQLDFAPVPSHVGLTERLHELAGFALERAQARAHLLELLGQRGIGGNAVFLDGAQLQIHRLQGVGERANELGDGGLASIEIAFHLLVGSLQRGLGQRRQRLAVGLQGLGGHRAERVAQGLFGVGEDRVPLVGSLETDLERGDARSGLLAHEHPGDERTGGKGED